MIRAIVFDIGETILCETRAWEAWAEWLAVPKLTFFAVLGSLIERGEHYRRVFEVFRPSFDLEAERRRRAAAGFRDRWRVDDLYPEVVSALNKLKADGYWIGLAGNQPGWAEADLRGMGLPVDMIAASARWGVEKPAPGFFERLIQESGFEASRIVYVGDRLDNDVLPAIEAGMRGVLVRRGPWGLVHARWREVEHAHGVIDALDEVPDLLSEWRVLGL